MAVISDQTIASAAIAAGFPGDQIATAVAVALAESGGDATALNTSNADGSRDHGLWQINSVHSADLAAGNWRDPADNARMAHAVWSRSGRQWTPWVAWRNGRHLPFLARGAAAARVTGDGVIPVVGLPGLPNLPGPFDDLAGQAGDALAVLRDRDLWVRIGIGLIGVVLLAVAVIGLVWTLGGRQRLKQAVQVLAPTHKVTRAATAARAATGGTNGSAG